MKEYNVKIIADNDELKMVFECDKEKNINCKGNGNCRECNYTTNAKYMKARQKDNSIGIKINLEAEEAIKNLEKLKQLLTEIKEEAYEIGIDLGQLKDYTTKRTYRYGKLIEEEIRCK